MRTASSVNVSPASAGPEAVVQVAADPATLLLAQLDQPAARSLQLLGEPDGVNGRRDLRSEVGDQAAVGLAQLLAGPRCEPKLSDGQALMHERERSGTVSGVPYTAATLVAAAERDRDVGQPKRLADRLDRGGQHGIGAQRALEPAAESGERDVRVVPLAVHQLVDEPLHAFADRLEADGDDAGDCQ